MFGKDSDLEEACWEKKTWVDHWIETCRRVRRMIQESEDGWRGRMAQAEKLKFAGHVVRHPESLAFSRGFV